MSMIMQYARLRPAELAELQRLVIDSPNRAFDYVDELADDEPEDGPVEQLRALDTDKAWDAIRHLLDLAGPPAVNVVTGGTRLTEDDWGYEPPRYLSPAEVATAARHLAPFEKLASHYDATAFRTADIYPQIWDEDGEALEYIEEWYADLVTFVNAAAANGDALVVWLT